MVFLPPVSLLVRSPAVIIREMQSVYLSMDKGFSTDPSFTRIIYMLI